MKIKISVKELGGIYESFKQVLDETRDASYMRWRKECGGQDGRRPSGCVSHPVADPSEQPPSVMTVAKTENGHGGGADLDIDGNFVGAADVADYCGAYAHAESVANFIIKNLLDFESWLDERLFNDEDATVERVRFHAEVSHDGRSITMHSLTEYKNADRCKTPREDFLIKMWELPDDDGLEDLEADVVGACMQWVCNYLGIDVGEYLDRDGKAGCAEPDGGKSEHDGVCGDITEDAMVEAADGDAAYVWRIVNGRLNALERWVEAKAHKSGISAFVTVFGDTVKVRIDDLGDMERGPLMVRETKVRMGCDKLRCADRILSEAYNVVFGKFEGLSYREFIDSISVAADGR